MDIILLNSLRKLLIKMVVLDAVFNEQRDTVHVLTTNAGTLTDTGDILTDTIVTLTKENAELKESLKKNSNNRSNPPSSDGLSRLNPNYSARHPGKSRGGTGT